MFILYWLAGVVFLVVATLLLRHARRNWRCRLSGPVALLLGLGALGAGWLDWPEDTAYKFSGFVRSGNLRAANRYLDPEYAWDDHPAGTVYMRARDGYNLTVNRESLRSLESSAYPGNRLFKPSLWSDEYFFSLSSPEFSAWCSARHGKVACIHLHLHGHRAKSLTGPLEVVGRNAGKTPQPAAPDADILSNLLWRRSLAGSHQSPVRQSLQAEAPVAWSR